MKQKMLLLHVQVHEKMRVDVEGMERGTIILSTYISFILPLSWT